MYKNACFVSINAHCLQYRDLYIFVDSRNKCESDGPVKFERIKTGIRNIQK